jgi:hypothetical protein
LVHNFPMKNIQWFNPLEQWNNQSCKIAPLLAKARVGVPPSPQLIHPDNMSCFSWCSKCWQSETR